jgi:hypothetical protein
MIQTERRMVSEIVVDPTPHAIGRQGFIDDGNRFTIVSISRTPVPCIDESAESRPGLDHVDVGPLIWRRHHEFDWDGSQVSQDEEFYLTPAEHFEPVMVDNPSPSEAEAFLRFAWWTPEEIAASDAVFAPGSLAEHLEALIRNGSPAEPVDVGI